MFSIKTSKLGSIVLSHTGNNDKQDTFPQDFKNFSIGRSYLRSPFPAAGQFDLLAFGFRPPEWTPQATWSRTKLGQD